MRRDPADGDAPRWLCALLTAVPVAVAAAWVAASDPPPRPAPPAPLEVRTEFDPEATVLARFDPEDLP